MPEIDATSIPQEIPFRRPTGVVIREPSTVSTTAPAIVSIPLPPPFSQSVGVSASTRPPVSSSSTHDLISLLRTFQPTPHPAPTSDSDRISALFEEFNFFRSEVRTNFADLKSFMTQDFSELSNKFDLHEQNCRTEAGPSHKRRHDQDDPDHQGHEGEMTKRQRVEGSSAREDQTQEEAVDREKCVDNVQDCSVEDLVNIMIENVDLSAMSNTLNISEQNIDNDMQIVVYVDPDTASRPIDLDDSEIANDMRSFFANFIEINSNDDDNIRYEKLCKVKEEEYEDIVVISDTKDDFVFMDAKDEEIADLLYRDLPSHDEIPEATQGPETVPATSTPVEGTTPTITAPSSTFEVGQSSRAQADVPPSETVIPPTILEEGPALSRQQRLRSLQQRHMASRLRSAFLEDSQSNIFVSRRRPINIHAILGVEKESDDYKY
ncbi:hypothetical protein L6452_41239 [Arctium lappa]|uniref:Uncharacterized protein n=1 Tax=Arctium lappa TaxID=4217 RepID=A0ACB8XPT3_ARCLA|nr:hypothetical protein L6452_41239 [Arctium lappa]